MKTPAVLVALLLLTALVPAQLEPQSEPGSIGPLGGSSISLVVHPQDADEILSIDYTIGLFRSTDGGATFVPHGAGISPNVREIYQDPSDDDALWAIDSNRVFVSTDFGASWTQTSLLPDYDGLRQLAISSDGQNLLALDAFNIYHSDNAGVSWSTVAQLVPFAGDTYDAIAFAPSDPDVAYLAWDDGVYRSDDGGATFARTGPYDEWVQALAVSPTDPDTVFVGTPFNGVSKSTDGGLNFTAITDPLTAGNAEFFVFEPGGRLWYATLSTLVVSDDGGATWADATAGWPINTPIPSALAVGPDGARFLGCEGGGLSDQSGGGLYRMPAGAPGNWTHIGFLGSRINDVAIAGPGGQRVIGIGGGVYAAAQGDTVIPTVWHADIGTDTRAVAIDPDDASRWVTGGVGAFQDNAQIVVLTGDGASFSKRYERFGAGRVTDIAFDPFDAQRLVAGMYPAAFGNEAIIRSVNGGQDWSEIGGTAGWASVAVSFDPHVPGRVLQLSETNQWSGSLDGGQTWIGLQPAWPASGPGVLLQFSLHEPGVLYRGDTGDGLQRSPDTGATWTNLGVGLQTWSDLYQHPHFPGWLWVSDDAGQVLISTDGGDSFDVALDVPLGSDGAGLALDAADGSLLVGTTEASTWELPNASPALRLGPGTTGSGGLVPGHYPVGLPRIGNGSFAIAGDDILGGAQVYLALGLGDTTLPAFGGTFYVDQIVILPSFLVGGTPGAAGEGSFVAPLPIGNDPILDGISLVTQFVVVGDPGSSHPGQRVLSDGLKFTFHL